MLAAQDRGRLTVLLRNFRAVMPAEVQRLFVLDLASSGELLAQDPFDDKVLGVSHAEREYFTAYFTPYSGRAAAATAVPYYVSGAYPSDRRDRSPLVAVSAAVISPPARGATWSGILVAEIDLSPIREWLAPLAGSAEDIYVVDGRGRLLGRASPAPGTLGGDLRSLEGSAVVAEALRGNAVTVEADDPARGGRRLVATAPIRAGPPGLPRTGADAHWNWQAIVVRSSEAALRELDDALAPARALRLGLVLVLLVSTYLLARSVASVMTHRRALAVTNEQLARATAAKSEFLARMSHELRTPLNAIIGFSEVLLQRLFGELNPKQEEYLHDILTSGEHQLALVNDILDLSKIEAGKMELDAGPTSVAAIVDGCMLLVRERAARHGIALAARIDPAVGQIIADERKVRQVVLNLLSNAVKYTPDGGSVDVSAERGEGEVILAVRDTGHGIAPEDQERIFAEFQQTGIGRAAEGSTGLGLSLARGMVELHGGTITVRSAIGAGSTFTVRLPAQGVAAASDKGPWVVADETLPEIGEGDGRAG